MIETGMLALSSGQLTHLVCRFPAARNPVYFAAAAAVSAALLQSSRCCCATLLSVCCPVQHSAPLNVLMLVIAGCEYTQPGAGLRTRIFGVGVHCNQLQPIHMG